MNVTVGIFHQYPDDIGVDKSSDLRLPFLQIAIKTRVLQRDRGLRRQKLQHCGSTRSEDMGSKVILEIKHPDYLGFPNKRHAWDGPCLACNHLRIG